MIFNAVTFKVDFHASVAAWDPQNYFFRDDQDFLHKNYDFQKFLRKSLEVSLWGGTPEFPTHLAMNVVQSFKLKEQNHVLTQICVFFKKKRKYSQIVSLGSQGVR